LELLNFLLYVVECAEVRLTLNLVKDIRNDLLLPVQFHELNFTHVLTKVHQHIVFNQRYFIGGDLAYKVSKIVFPVRVTNFVFESFLNLKRQESLLDDFHSLSMALHSFRSESL
jgi:hypothetical protein